jgi:hypothetical protein
MLEGSACQRRSNTCRSIARQPNARARSEACERAA